MNSTHEKENAAFQLFEKGYNCAQSVFGAYAKQLKLDLGITASVACGFGAGMGRLQETCGTVTGAFMALSVASCQPGIDNTAAKETAYSRIREFDTRFRAIHGSLLCKELLRGVDLNTEEGHKTYNDEHMKENVCKKCIADAIAITDDLLK